MYNKIQDINIEDKKVVLRCDYNVPIVDGVIQDDTKIKASLKTIEYLLEHNCKIIILSHLGKIKSKQDLKKYTLAPIAKRLLELLNANNRSKIHVVFSNHTRSSAIVEKVAALNSREILMVENTRFEDYPSNYESSCNEELSKFWASLGDIFVNEAFASSHRKHASTYGIAKYIPGYIGFRVQEELEMLDKYILNAEHPFTVVMGGAKLEDKIKVIEKLLPLCDHLLLTGGIANTFLKALNINIGFSLCSNDEELIDKIKQILLQYRSKIVLPFDAIVGSSYDKEYTSLKMINKLDDNEIIYDLGHKTIEKYSIYLNESQTVFINGTAGKYEDPRYANGTKEILAALNYSGANVIVGGGDCVAAVNKFNYKDAFTYLCTGGGASLDYIANGSLIALEPLKKEENYEVLDF